MNYSENQTQTRTSEPFQKLYRGENTEPSVPFSEIFQTGEFITGLNGNGGKRCLLLLLLDLLHGIK